MQGHDGTAAATVLLLRWLQRRRRRLLLVTVLTAVHEELARRDVRLEAHLLLDSRERRACGVAKGKDRGLGLVLRKERVGCGVLGGENRRDGLGEGVVLHVRLGRKVKETWKRPRWRERHSSGVLFNKPDTHGAHAHAAATRIDA
jgi:hypothetical protein